MAATLTAYRRRKGLTQQELGEAVGVTKAMIYRYETKGAKPSRELRKKIADVLDVNYEDLWGNTAEADSVVFVPVIDSIITVSAGEGDDCSEVEWSVIDKVPFSSKALMGYNWQGADYKIITVQGNSMEPVIHDGDNILFAENIDVYNGDVAVVSINSKLYVKGILYSKDGITLVSYNKAEYPERFFSANDYDIRILGKVLRILPKALSVPSVI